MRIDPPVTPFAEPPHPGFFDPPARFVEAEHEGRLIPMLRAAARLRDPEVILAWSATEHFRAARARVAEEARDARDLGTALADLAVTGRAAYERFRTLNLAAVEGNTRLRIEAQVPGLPATDDEIAAAMNAALDRAFAVAWALRGPVSLRGERRARLGWIAVSGEDDKPHRPVNVPAPPYEQYEVRVLARRPDGTIWVTTRFVMAFAEPPAAPAVTPAARALPEDPAPVIPPDHKVLIFLHGHSSGAEEALDIIPHLLREGLEQGTRFAVISLDLPNNGYSEAFDHTSIAAADATTFPFLTTDNIPIATPILDFLEGFVVSFVDSLEAKLIELGLPQIKSRIAGVFGGSLGGNLGLRLGRRTPMPDWLASGAIVAWSPASVWKSMAADSPRREGPRVARDNYNEPEVETTRRDYFRDVYDRDPQPGVIKRQPVYWYRKGYLPADVLIATSRIARREVYNRFFREWHWRVACEQLVFSHDENEVYGDDSTPFLASKNTVRTLLAAGEVDDYAFTGIYTATKTVASRMTKTRGRLLLLEDSGHSIHVERPQYFAGEIAKFLHTWSMVIDCAGRLGDKLVRVRGFDFTARQRFDLSVEQMIAAVAAGAEVFASALDGTLAEVKVGQTRGAPGPGGEIRRFLRTEADDVETNNLALLPACAGP